MVIEVSAQGTHVLQLIDQKSDGHDADHPPWQLHTSDRLKG